MLKTFNLTNKYIVLTTPLILYSLISSVYLVISMGNSNFINLLFAIILLILMTSAFIAGWFNMIKLAITDYKDEPNSLIKEFVPGVGEYFLPSLGAFFIILTTIITALTISYFIGINNIGDPGISSEALTNALKDSVALKNFVANLNTEQLVKINLWNSLILTTTAVSYFLIFLYIPALFLKNKNPFVAYLISLKDLFSKKIFKTLAIFLLILMLSFFLSLLSTIFGNFLIIHFLITLLNYYFFTVISVGVFYYYFVNFIKPTTGQNVDIEV